MESSRTVASSIQRSSFSRAVLSKSSTGAPAFPLWFLPHRIMAIRAAFVSHAHALCLRRYQPRPLMHNRLWVDWGIKVKVMNIWEHSTGVFGGGGKVNVIGFGLRLGHALDNLWVWTDFRKHPRPQTSGHFQLSFEPRDPLEANATGIVHNTKHTCQSWPRFHQSRGIALLYTHMIKPLAE